MALIINGERIDDDVLEEEFDAIKEHHQSLGEVVCCDRDQEFSDRARTNVLNRTLLQQASVKRFGEPADADVDQMLARLKEEHGSEEDFYKNTGYRPQDEFAIRRRVAASISVDKILVDAIGEEPDPTDAEVQAFYEEHLDDYRTAEEVRALHIFFEPAGHQDADRCFGEARKARERALKGEDFMTLAKEVTGKEEEEIDLGFYKRGELMHELEIVTFSMRQDEISPIVATHFGFHLLKMIGRKEPTAFPLDEIREQVAEAFVADRREGRINGLVESLTAEATIEEIEPDHATEEV